MAREWIQIRVLPVSDETTPWFSDPEWCRCLNTVLGRLDESQRRWVLGLLSLQTGRGSISRLAEITGVDNDTFTKARRELAQNLETCPEGRIRRQGAGRKALTQTDPTLESDLDKLIQSDIAGDPSSGDRWVRQSLRQLCHALKRQGHNIGRMTVRALLQKKGFHYKPTGSGTRGRLTPTETGSSPTSKRRVKRS